ncbi:unnamed protein product, partial [Cylicostephanus goldi]
MLRVSGYDGDDLESTSTAAGLPPTKTVENLPVPVTISDIHSFVNAEEKYECGVFSFTTVITVGIVKSAFEQEDTICHILGDPEDMDKVCRVVTYSGISDVEVEKTLFEGGMANICQLFTSNGISGLRVPNVLYGKDTLLFVVGILRSFSNDHGILSFHVRELVNESEFKAF